MTAQNLNNMIKQLTLSIVLLLGSHLVNAETPKELLKQMCAAMNAQSYHGTFVHLHNNKMESMEIYRRKNDKGEVEKLLSLNGEAREIIRNSDEVTCFSKPESKAG